MTEANLRQLRVLHIVSSGAVSNGLQQQLFMPLLTRLPKQRVKAQVVCLSPNVVPGAVLRQNGAPVHEVSLSRHRFSFGAFKELVQTVRLFRPDVIQAWGHTAQIASIWVRQRCDWKPRVVWTVASTAPLPRDAGLIDRRKLEYAAKLAAKADRIVYASEAGASQHRRVGFPEGGYVTAPPGVDAVRFKPDFAARRKLREQLQIPPEAFVVGMVAPFQPEYDHANFLKAIGELIKTNPNVWVLLAGHGVQKGNAPLMTLLGGGTLGTHAHVLGEWSDLSSLFNACEIVCSSAVHDGSRMTLAMAMLCGVPCVGTGMGAQGEVIGQHGIAIEPGNAASMQKAISRVMQLTPEKRAQMAQGARKHALQNFVYVRSLQKYLQLYYDLVGRETLVTEEVPTPEIDATVTVPPPLPKLTPKKPITVAELSDPDSLEAKVAEATELPKWRVQQEEERARKEAEVSQKVAETLTAGDVLQMFESRITPSPTAAAPREERARGVTEDVEDLLPAEMLASPTPTAQRAPATPPQAPPAAQHSPPVQPAAAPKIDAEPKAATQPLTPAPAAGSAPLTRPAATNPAPVASPAPLTRPLATEHIPVAGPTPLTRPPATKPEVAPEPMAWPVVPTEPAQAAQAPPSSALEATANLSLFPEDVLPAVPTAAASEVEEPSLQLQLLPDPPPADIKRAVGEST